MFCFQINEIDFKVHDGRFDLYRKTMFHIIQKKSGMRETPI